MVEDIFSRALCGECHEVVRPENSPTKDWDVRPVRVADLWMPKARFDHESHKTADCTLCHKAPESRVSRDVLMPPIATCRECHAGGMAQAALPSACTMCHVYHLEMLPPMLPAHSRAANAVPTGMSLAETR
jgi:predicted CXXCH cytochrome family protein